MQSKTLQNPVIVLPGITATSLLDEYPLSAQEVWAELRKEYHRVSLHPDDPRYESREPSRVRPVRMFGLAYDDLVAALRYDLTTQADQPTPVFQFPYDWRQPLQRSAATLNEFVEEVVARTRLLRHYKGWSDERVDLVAHSMGGLVVCEYLSAFGSKKLVRKVATLGTPYGGSVEAIVKLLTGLGNLSGDVPTEREREMARSTPAVYHLLPSYSGAVSAEEGSGLTVDLFDPGAWQQGILQSLTEYVRLHSVHAGSTQDNRERAAGLFASLLSDARASRGRVQGLQLGQGGVAESDWLVVAGAHRKTRVTLRVARVGGKPYFRLGDSQWADAYPGNLDDMAWDTGDGTVPLRAARPEFLKAESIVVAVPDDFELLELKDRALMGVAGFHAMLPNLNLAQRLVLKHLRSAYRGQVWGRRLPGVAKNTWSPPFKMEDRT